jgi:hypothetical protein
MSRRAAWRISAALSAAMCATSQLGCATVKPTVKPSEREILSRSEMDPSSKDERLEAEWESHVETSRDFSIGGHGAAGGGCGCG